MCTVFIDILLINAMTAGVASLEASCAATYLEDYVDCLDNLPRAMQILISEFWTLDLQYRNLISKMNKLCQRKLFIEDRRDENVGHLKTEQPFIESSSANPSSTDHQTGNLGTSDSGTRSVQNSADSNALFAACGSLEIMDTKPHPENDLPEVVLRHSRFARRSIGEGTDGLENSVSVNEQTRLTRRFCSNNSVCSETAGIPISTNIESSNYSDKIDQDFCCTAGLVPIEGPSWVVDGEEVEMKFGGNDQIAHDEHGRDRLSELTADLDVSPKKDSEKVYGIASDLSKHCDTVGNGCQNLVAIVQARDCGNHGEKMPAGLVRNDLSGTKGDAVLDSDNCWLSKSCPNGMADRALVEGPNRDQDKYVGALVENLVRSHSNIQPDLRLSHGVDGENESVESVKNEVDDGIVEFSESSRNSGCRNEVQDISDLCATSGRVDSDNKLSCDQVSVEGGRARLPPSSESAGSISDDERKSAVCQLLFLIQGVQDSKISIIARLQTLVAKKAIQLHQDRQNLEALSEHDGNQDSLDTDSKAWQDEPAWFSSSATGDCAGSLAGNQSPAYSVDSAATTSGGGGSRVKRSRRQNKMVQQQYANQSMPTFTSFFSTNNNNNNPPTGTAPLLGGMACDPGAWSSREAYGPGSNPSLTSGSGMSPCYSGFAGSSNAAPGSSTPRGEAGMSGYPEVGSARKRSGRHDSTSSTTLAPAGVSSYSSLAGLSDSVGSSNGAFGAGTPLSSGVDDSPSGGAKPSGGGLPSKRKAGTVSRGDFVGTGLQATMGGGQSKKKKMQQPAAKDDKPVPPQIQVFSHPPAPDEETYCLCNQVSFGEMVGCDNDVCQIEWFHFSCVGITKQPKGKWFCPNCRGDRATVKRQNS